MKIFLFILGLLFSAPMTVESSSIFKITQIPSPPIRDGYLASAELCNHQLFIATRNYPGQNNVLIWTNGRWSNQNEGLPDYYKFYVDKFACNANRIFVRMHAISAADPVQDLVYVLDLKHWIETQDPFPKDNDFIDPINQDRNTYPSQNCFVKQKFETPDGIFGTFSCSDDHVSNVLEFGQYHQQKKRWQFIYQVGPTSDMMHHLIRYDDHVFYIISQEEGYPIKIQTLKIKRSDSAQKTYQ